MATTDTTEHSSPAVEVAPERRATPRDFRPDIEGLRAVAVAAVVFFHSGLAVGGGYIGVDVFFVISGYLITQHLFGEVNRTGRISVARFYARRVRRILPAATVVIVATLLVAFIWAPPLEIHSYGLDAICAALFCINIRIAESGANYFANPAPSPFQQYWSLSVEEQFYLLWPLLLFGLAAVRRRLSRQGTITVFLLAVIAVSLYLSATLTTSSPVWAYFGLQTRAWELALGAIVAVNVETIGRVLRPVAGIVSWVGLAAIAGAALFFTSTTPYPGLPVALPVGGAALVIAAGLAAHRRGAESVLGLAPVQYVGRISYSWYLWHWPVFILLPFVLGHVATRTDMWAALIGSFLLAAASYAWVEQPIRKNQSLVARPRRGLVLGASLIGVSLLCAVLVMALVVIPGGEGSTPSAPVSDAAVMAGSPTAYLLDVAGGTRVDALPPHLSPPLADAPADDAGLACLNDTPASAPPPQDTCVLGDVHASRTVVLYGDSHAWQWMGPLAAIAETRHWKLLTYTKASCPAEDNQAASAYQGYIDCAPWRQAVFQRLSLLRPALVVMSSDTQGYSTPQTMAKTISLLRADGSRVVWLEDSPTPGFNIPDCLSKYPSDVQRCSYRPASGLFAARLRAALNQAAARAGAMLVDPMPWLCTPTVCPPVIGNSVAYFDQSHVSYTYARSLAPELSAALGFVMPSA